MIKRKPTPAKASDMSESDAAAEVAKPVAGDKVTKDEAASSSGQVEKGVDEAKVKVAAAADQAEQDNKPIGGSEVDAGGLVPIRVLIDHDGFRCNTLVSLPAEVAKAAVSAGWADDSDAAVAQVSVDVE